MSTTDVTEAREAYADFNPAKHPCPLCGETRCEHSLPDQKNQLFNNYLRALDKDDSPKFTEKR